MRTFLTIFVLLVVFANKQASALLGRLFQRKFTSAKAIAKPIQSGRPRLPPKNLDNRGLETIFQGNKQWKAEMLKKDRRFFRKLGNIHKPEYMYIGTSPFCHSLSMINLSEFC